MQAVFRGVVEAIQGYGTCCLLDAATTEAAISPDAGKLLQAWKNRVESSLHEMQTKFGVHICRGTFGNGEIDVIDEGESTAYQLRLFGKQPEARFCEDILLVALANNRRKWANERAIKRLVFITRQDVKQRLTDGVVESVAALSESEDDEDRILDFEVEIVALI